MAGKGTGVKGRAASKVGTAAGKVAASCGYGGGGFERR